MAYFTAGQFAMLRFGLAGQQSLTIFDPVRAFSGHDDKPSLRVMAEPLPRESVAQSTAPSGTFCTGTLEAAIWSSE